MDITKITDHLGLLAAAIPGGAIRSHTHPAFGVTLLSLLVPCRVIRPDTVAGSANRIGWRAVLVMLRAYHPVFLLRFLDTLTRDMLAPVKALPGPFVVAGDRAFGHA